MNTLEIRKTYNHSLEENKVDISNSGTHLLVQKSQGGFYVVDLEKNQKIVND